jgi:hypothetical protein
MKTAQYTKSLTIALRQEIYDRIKVITDKEGISMADWIREASEKSLFENRGEGDFENETKNTVITKK